MPAAVRFLLLAAILTAGQGAHAQLSETQAPEGASALAHKEAVLARRSMVIAANPYASEAGRAILRAGGNAVDAAIATQLVLNLVEPQSSGIGGGALMLYFDGKAVTSYDGRETAPQAVDGKLFKRNDGSNMGYAEAVFGGRAVGVPGVLRMFELAHRAHGRLPWAQLFAPAIALAQDGFQVSARLNKLIGDDPLLRRDPVAAAYFYDDKGAPRPVGYLLKNPALAETLREIARDGAQAFYQGRIARDIVAKVRGHAANPGAMTEADMAAYRAQEHAPLCSDYRKWTVCGAPPPSSGGIAIAQMLGIFEARPLQPPRNGVQDAEAMHVFTEAGRLAFADRARYVADTDFVALPGGDASALLDKSYLAARAALIGPRSMGAAPAGVPPVKLVAQGDDTSPEFPSTSHLSIVDADGHAVALTTTIESAFGARQMVDGFLLNNQLTDFSADAVDANGLIANRVEGGKRPRSSMSPTFVFDKDSKQLRLAIGSPGGAAIIPYVAKVLVAVLDWGMDLQRAIELPNVVMRGAPVEVERGRAGEALAEGLRARGHTVRINEQTSGLHGFERVSIDGTSYWRGAADPRREGVALGD